VRRSLGTQVDRSSKRSRRNAARVCVPEMPEQQARMRTGAAGERRAIIVSPTGTKHRPVKRKMPRVARSRAKSPAIGRQKETRK
jgi:hypothetical protein